MSYMTTVISDGAVGFWELAEASGTTATDQAGNSNGTYTTNLTLGVLGIPGGGALTAISQGGSSGGYVSIPDVAAQHVGDTFTLEAWTKRATSGTNARFLGGANLSTPGLQFNTSNQLLLTKLGVSSIVASTSTITDTNWHHVVATKSGSTVHLYIDGSDVTGAVTNATMPNTAGWLIMKDGINANFPEFGFGVQFVAVYPTALTLTQVANHYSLGSTGTPPSNDVAPVASGTPLVGQTLTSTAGSWTDDGTGALSFQWQRDNLGGLTYGDIGGATGSTYVVQTNDYQCNLRCAVTDTEGSGAGAATANSNAIGLVTLRQRIGIPILT